MTEWQIFVRTWEKHPVSRIFTMSLDVSANETGASIMRKVMERQGLTEIRLLYAGRQLEPEDTLSSRGILKEATLHRVTCGGRHYSLAELTKS